MQFNSKSLSTCEICHRPRQKGNHDACSKMKQQLASKKSTGKSSHKTYKNPRLLTGFLKTIHD